MWFTWIRSRSTSWDWDAACVMLRSQQRLDKQNDFHSTSVCIGLGATISTGIIGLIQVHETTRSWMQVAWWSRLRAWDHEDHDLHRTVCGMLYVAQAVSSKACGEHKLEHTNHGRFHELWIVRGITWQTAAVKPVGHRNGVAGWLHAWLEAMEQWHEPS